MKLFAASVFEHIKQQSERHRHADGLKGGKLIIMVPRVPAPVALEIGTLLEDYAIRAADNIKPLVKVASGLHEEWRKAVDPNAQIALKAIYANGWVDEAGNLTRYRNVAIEEGVLTAVLLIGADMVVDSGSLADFHLCSLQAIWERELNESFSNWTSKVFERANIGYEKNALEHFDRVLVPLLEYGIADIIQISSLLESLDLAASQDGKDAVAVLLRSLGCFGLPNYSGYSVYGRKAFGPYIGGAISFFAYDGLIEERVRNQKLNKVKAFEEKHSGRIGQLFAEEVKGPLQDDQAFIDAIKKYIETNDQDTRRKLLLCDYVTIDEILGFRKSREPGPKKERVTKLAGSIVEVVLTGLWGTLRDFKKIVIEKGLLPQEALSGITIEAEIYKHDSEGESAEQREENARAYLARLLGGVDDLLEDYIELDRIFGEECTARLRSKLLHDEIRFQPARTAEPGLQFVIEINAEDLEEAVTRRFAWRLPEIQPYRVAANLFEWAARDRERTKRYCLPIFHLPYFEEIMLARDDEEARRVLLQCLQGEEGDVFNMLEVPDIDREDALLEEVQQLAFEYGSFIEQASEKGIFYAYKNNWDKLRRAYEITLENFLNSKEHINSPLGKLLFRAFLIVSTRGHEESGRWVWDEYEPNAIVTVLHPSLLEMLQASFIFLFAAFNSEAKKQLRAPGIGSFQDSIWRGYIELAAIKMPLQGLITDRNHTLSTEVKGEGLIHRVGELSSTEASLTTRLLLKYEDYEEEDISDAELFRETRDSKLIHRIFKDYVKLHPYAEDAISIAIYRNEDLQAVIAATNRYLKEVHEPRFSSEVSYGGKYTFSITVFSEYADNAGIARWIDEWKERWELAETQPSLEHYRKSRISISHRIVSPHDYYRQFRDLIKGLDVDIAILTDFIGAGAEGNDFERVEPYDVTSRTLKFPILEKAFCALGDPGKQMQRMRLLSNRQFRISAWHTEIMARIKKEATPGAQYVVLGLGDYTPWQGVMDELHQHAGWVVCIDPNIDERLISQKGSDASETREIIGFGSGVGAYGEANYTISTEQFRLSDVRRKLKSAIDEIYLEWGGEESERIAQSVLEESQKLSGLSLVRATGIGEYIRDFMAYSLVRKLLNAGDDVLCDHIITLDAYRHWFESAPSDMRPDLLWLVVRMNEKGRIELDVRILECKMARMTDEHSEKARQQIENGFRHLAGIFRPRVDEGPIEDERPDQRYWWLQLHRLIASKGVAKEKDKSRILASLERLAEGDFSISWRAAVVLFRTDQSGGGLAKAREWTYPFEGQELPIDLITVGSDFVRDLCIRGSKGNLPWGDGAVVLSPVIKRDAFGVDENEDAGNGVREEPTKGEDALGEGEETEEQSPKPEDAGSGVTVQQPSRKLPTRIFLGQAVSGSRDVFWEFGNEDLSNRHVLIFGASGMGKTYAIQCLLYELGSSGQNSLIVDYANGFFENQLEDEFKSLCCGPGSLDITLG